MPSLRRSSWLSGALVGYIVLLLGVSYGLWQTNVVADRNTDVNCAVASLISYVPSIPYDTETIENFRGWVRARAELVQTAGIERNCDPAVVATLERTARTDIVLLRELDRRVDREQRDAARRP